jgi:HEAT repeat protein
MTAGILLLSSLGCRDRVNQQVETVASLVRAADYSGLQALLNDSDPELRCRAGRALAWVRSLEAAAAHRALLTFRDCGWEVRSEAGWRLLEEDPAGSWTAVAGQLEDEDPAIRWNAARGLGELGPVESVPFLEKCIGDGDAFVAAWCAWAVCRHAGGSECEEPNMDLTGGKVGP